MSVYLRNWVICLIINVVVFLIGWGCIVPDQMMDNTHLFGIIGNVEIVKGNTSTVFGVCSIMSTLVMIVGMVEAIIEDCRPRSCPTRIEKPRKSPKPGVSGMEMKPASPEKVVDEDKDPKIPTMD